MTNENARILLVEDDPHLGFLLKENFVNKNFDIDWRKDGEDGWIAFTQNHYDLCIVDVMLPKRDGFSLVKDIRKENTEIPVIFLTARGMEDDVTEGFNSGADDYITKPFRASELFLRVNAILKRTFKTHSKLQEKVYRMGNIAFDYTNRFLVSNEESKKLSTKECELFRILCENMNELVSRNKILVEVWGNDDYFSSKSMDVYLTRIRKLLKKESNIELQNFHGTGYKLIVRSPAT